MSRSFFFILSLLLLPSFAFAVGGGGGGGSGGGGGGTSQCDQDEWECSDWDECTLDAEQSRECELSFDCQHVTDPEPTTSRSCTPECTQDTWECSGWSPCFADATQTRKCTKTDDCSLIETDSPIVSQSCDPNCTDDEWECEDWGSCSAAGVQTRECELSFDCQYDEEPSPSLSQSCTPSCTQDTWICEDWNACDAYGNQSRSCSISNDCQGVVSEKPASSQRCSYLQCESGELVDRVTCRLELEPAGLARELELRYFPEVCRTLEEEEQEDCVLYYADYEPCWDLKTHDERVECAREVLLLPTDITQAKTDCANDAECIKELEEHVYQLILFRFYDLEQRAEAYMDEGVSTEKTAEFVTKVVENKINLLKADSYNERVEIIQQMREDWNMHVTYVRSIINR